MAGDDTSMSSGNLTSRPSDKMKLYPRSLEEELLVYLAYALFGVVMIGCLVYIMNAFDTEEPPNPKRPKPEK